MQPYFEENGFPADADFISVNTASQESRTNYPPNLWLEREGWTAPVLVDDEAGSVARAFGLSAFPYWVGIDGNGAVRFRQEGPLSGADVTGLATALANS